MQTGCLEKIETASAKDYFMKRWREWLFAFRPEQDGARPPASPGNSKTKE